MRTTLTLEPDVAARIRQEITAGNLSFKEVINERLRAGFGIKPAKTRKPFQVKPHRSGYKPGVDALKLNQLADDLEAEAFLEARGKRRR